MTDAGSTRPKLPTKTLDAPSLAAWMLIQLMALAASAFRVRFWARQPLAAEQLGLATMLATQIAAGSLLFPMLLRNWRSTIVAIAAAWPLALLASFLADAELHRLVLGEAYVSVWLITLFVFARVIHNPSCQLFAVSLAGAITLGIPLLGYLRWDFSSEGSLTPKSLAFWGPIGGGLSQIFPNQDSVAGWTFLGCLFACGVVVNCVRRDQNQ
jgi:hypothetical protein